MADEGVVFLDGPRTSVEGRSEDETDIIQHWQDAIFTTRDQALGDQETMRRLLGYEIKETGDSKLDTQILAVHAQRMEDILNSDVKGEQMLRAKKICEERGIWCRELSKEEWENAVIWFRIHGEVMVWSREWAEMEKGVQERIAGQGREGSVGMDDEGGKQQEKARKREERLREKTRTDPMAAGRFRARRAAKRALQSPKEMRDLAEERVGRVKTGRTDGD